MQPHQWQLHVLPKMYGGSATLQVLDHACFKHFHCSELVRNVGAAMHIRFWFYVRELFAGRIEDAALDIIS